MPRTSTEIAHELLQLQTIRSRCSQVHELAKQGKLEYFDYHPENEQAASSYCVQVITKDFASNYASIPPHGRWRHIDAGGVYRISPLLKQWKVDDREKCKALVDLFLVSVLLDAGAGNVWSYRETLPDGSLSEPYSRSEGLGVASFHMFKAGLFSSDPGNPFQVDAKALSDPQKNASVKAAFQVTETNQMVGLDGRTKLLRDLSTALSSNPKYFLPSQERKDPNADPVHIRPGNLIDYLETRATRSGDQLTVPVSALWEVLITGLASIWPARLTLGGVSLGDVWPCQSLKKSFSPGEAEDASDLIPFHKLTGWTTYSLIEPMETILGWKFMGVESLTGLPEYRNGGLLIDLGVLSIKPNSIPKEFYPQGSTIPRLPPSHPAIVEWRAMTVIELDRIATLIREEVKYPLTLAQILESATWKGGRKIAKEKRQETGGPPIEIESDGTVF